MEDSLLKNIDKSKDKCEIISFDIFDTILLRTLSKPEDLFFLLGQKFITKFPNSKIKTPKMFQHIRIIAEKKSRANANETSLKKIYSFMPLNGKEKVFCELKEFEIELQNIYLNPRIYQVIKELKKENKRIILTSDMYLTAQQIIELLKQAGFDLDIVEELFVSSEIGETKHQGNLFKVIKNKYQDASILHIGDNYISDFIKAKENGLDSIHYNKFDENKNVIFDMEKFIYKKGIPELESLRKVLAVENINNDVLGSSYNFGVQIYGPVYTIFCEWILKYCEDQGISVIAPLMREGMLFSQMLLGFIENRGLSIKVTPIYISRKASYLLDKENISSLEIQKQLENKKFELKNLLNLFGLDKFNVEFEQFLDYTIEDLINIHPKKFEKLKEFLMSDEIIQYIRLKAKEQKEMFKSYIGNLVGSEGFVTVDLGFNGTMQQQIDYCLNSKNHHLIMIGGEKITDRIFSGMNISYWLGSAVETPNSTRKIMNSPEIIEAMTNYSIGSTLGYVQVNDQIKPVTEKITFPEYHINVQKNCWRGIKVFQKEWLKLVNKKPFLLDRVMNNHQGILSIIERLITMPQYQEARILGNLLQNECYNFTRSDKIIRNQDYDWLKKFTVEEFIEKTTVTFYPYEIYWPQGVVENYYPNYFKNKFLVEKYKNDPLTNKIYRTLDGVNFENQDNIYVYGAGELGEKVYRIILAKGFDIKGFIDRNAEVKNREFSGKTIWRLDEMPQTPCTIILASLSFKDEIISDINKHYDRKVIINLITL